jgi:hypothetical protein
MLSGSPQTTEKNDHFGVHVIVINQRHPVYVPVHSKVLGWGCHSPLLQTDVIS